MPPPGLLPYYEWEALTAGVIRPFLMEAVEMSTCNFQTVSA
jgi:hypothetical protein